MSVNLIALSQPGIIFLITTNTCDGIETDTKQFNGAERKIALKLKPLPHSKPTGKLQGHPGLSFLKLFSHFLLATTHTGTFLSHHVANQLQPA